MHGNEKYTPPPRIVPSRTGDILVYTGSWCIPMSAQNQGKTTRARLRRAPQGRASFPVVVQSGMKCNISARNFAKASHTTILYNLWQHVMHDA